MDIKKLTLEQKIGQMIVAGFPSDNYDEHINELIEQYNIGNIILFARNVNGIENLAKLNSIIQENMLKNNGIPAFILIDQEGGMVTRIQKGATFFPGNMAFAAANGNETYSEGRIAGKELRELGINFNLAPVLDVNSNPVNPVIGVRSYSDDPVKVANYGVDYIRGLQSNGVIATAKHFPGMGDSDIDSHLDLPRISHDMARLEKIELFPFAEAIKNGVDAIMTAHVLFPAIEPEKLPVTLSYKVLTELLRKKMDFHGLIITDCMQMKAIDNYFGTVNAVVMAVKAGADLICISHSLELQIDSVKAIKEAVLKGDIPESRIDESVERILEMKKKYSVSDIPCPDMKKITSVVGCSEHLEFARSVSEKSITVVKDKKNLLPVKTNNIITISTEPVLLTGADDQYKKRRAFCEVVKQKLGGEEFLIALNPDKEAISKIALKSKEADSIIIGTYNANLNKGQAELVKEIMKVNCNIIVVSLRNPYDILMFGDISTYICAYEYTPLSIDSVINVLTGQKEAVGKLPVVFDL